MNSKDELLSCVFETGGRYIHVYCVYITYEVTPGISFTAVLEISLFIYLITIYSENFSAFSISFLHWENLLIFLWEYKGFKTSYKIASNGMFVGNIVVDLFFYEIVYSSSV